MPVRNFHFAISLLTLTQQPKWNSYETGTSTVTFKEKKKFLTSKGFKSNSNNNSLQKNKGEFPIKEKKINHKSIF